MPASSHLCRHHNVEQCPRTPPASSARWKLKNTTQRFANSDRKTKLASSMRPLPGASHEAHLQLRLRHGLIALPLWRLEELISGLRCLACFATPCLRLGAEAAHGLPDCGAVDDAQPSVQPVNVPLMCKSVLHTHCRLHTTCDQRQAALARSTCVGNLGCVCASSAGACDGFALAPAPQHVCTSSMMTFTSSDNRVWRVRNTRNCLELQDLMGGRFLACAKLWDIGVQLHICAHPLRATLVSCVIAVCARPSTNGGMIKIEELPNDAPVEDPIQKLQRKSTTKAASQEPSTLVHPKPGLVLLEIMPKSACMTGWAAQ